MDISNDYVLSYLLEIQILIIKNKRMKKYLFYSLVFIGIAACNNAKLEQGIRYNIVKMTTQEGLQLAPFGDDTTVEIFEDWVILHYTNGEKIVVNRDKIWSIKVK